MKFIRSNGKLLAVAASCLVIGGAGSAIATAGAASNTSGGANATAAKAHAGLKRLRILGRAVHGTVVVATKSGFVNISFDRGTVQSVNGQQLTLSEGTKTATYKTVTLTIPAGAKVRDNHNDAKLSDLKPGQRVIVVQTPTRTIVRAHDLRTP